MKQILALIVLGMLPLTSFAADKKIHTLKSVMQGLAKSMDDLNRGIFYEDFKIIGKAASNIAVHPKPKSQLPTILKTLNVRMLKFKSIDGKVHDSAVEIMGYAKKRDMNGILKKHQVIMNNCVACHTQFRPEISKALWKKEILPKVVDQT